MGESKRYQDIMLSEIIQSEKDKYLMTLLMWNFRNKAKEQRRKETTTKQI